MRTFTSTQYTPNGNSIEVFDTKALQMEMNAVDSALNVLQQSAIGVDERLKQLEHEVTNLKSLERLVMFCSKQHPEVVVEFLAAERAKIRMEIDT